MNQQSAQTEAPKEEGVRDAEVKEETSENPSDENKA